MRRLGARDVATARMTRRKTTITAMLRAHTVLMLLAGAAAQKGSAYRCRDSHQSCAVWASRGECTSNYDYMAMNCPVSCELCGNAGLHPTPAWWQLDYVCDGRLAVRPSVFPERHALRPGCTFHCRDNMTDACSSAAASGACESSAELMRFQCPASCGVCKGLRMETATSESYPNYPCTTSTGDDPEHQASCPSWVAANECVKNFGFMSKACEESCGLCSTSAPRLVTDAERSHSTKRTKSGRGRGESASVSASDPAAAMAGQSPKTAKAKATRAKGTAAAAADPPLEARRAAAAEPVRGEAANARADVGAAADASVAGKHATVPEHAEPAAHSGATAAASAHTDKAAAQMAATGSTGNAGTDGDGIRAAGGDKAPSKKSGVLHGLKRAWGAAVNKFKKKAKAGEDPGKAEL